MPVSLVIGAKFSAALLGTECLCPSKVHMLDPDPQFDGLREVRTPGGDQVMRAPTS